MKGWLDNYNDSKVSVPQGFVGDGYNTKGRNYSPAWGGQFQDGGELIPMAQNGRATRADSLAVLNSQLALNKFYDKEIKAGRLKKRALDFKGYKGFQPTPKDISKLNEANLQFYRKEIKDRQEYKGGLYDDQYKKFFKLTPNQVSNLEYKGLGNTKGSNKNKAYYRDIITPQQNLAAPMALIDSRIAPQGSVEYDSVDAISRYPGGSVSVYDYDPLAVKPFNMLTDAEKKLRVKKYGTNGVPKSYLNTIKDKLNKDPKPNINKKLNVDPKIRTQQEVVQPDLPRAEAVNLLPMQQLGSMSAPTTSEIVREPKSYNVNMQRYNMQGPNDYYKANEEGVDYERAMQIKAASDAFNKDILKRYGPQNEYRTPKSAEKAAERLKQLRSEFEMTPNYQMGGEVYPVNYVPQAQNGDIIASNLPDPVNGIIYDPEGERTYYDDRLDRIVLTPSSDFAPRQSVINHEKFHKYQFDNLLSNYDIAHKEAVPLFKKPSMVSTDEEYYKFHDRKGREAQEDIKNVKSNYPEFTFVPDEVLFNKIIDREQYSDPFTLEGGAQEYENSLNKFQMGGSIPGAVGFSYARTQSPAPSNGPYAKKTKASAKNGEVIKDDMGQWAHPGEITEISGDTMATHGYGNIPLYVVPDKGKPRIVQPNTGTQKFPGAKKFTEYPMAKDGLRQEQKGLVNLDQLTNFTNYNKPQPGGWLNKYN